MDLVIPAVSTPAALRYVLYSEYSASFIMPLRNAVLFKGWVADHLGTHRSLDTIALSVRGAFPHLFRPSPALNAAIAPVRAELAAARGGAVAEGGEDGRSPAYVAVHIRKP